MHVSKKIALTAMLVIGGVHSVYAGSQGRGLYLGGFGGAGQTDDQEVVQSAVAYKRGELAHDVNNDPWDLYVNTKGHTKHDTLGLGGVHVGYEWAENAFHVKPAVEVEAFYLGANQHANLANPQQEDGVWTTTANGHEEGEVSEHHSIAAGVHQFSNRMHMGMGILMANGVFTYETHTMFKPYVGAGLGLAYIKMSDAQSYQTGPGGVERINGAGTDPVNHFNAEKHDSNLAIAAQAKLGLRAELNQHWSAFAEYRYLHVESKDFTFGSTHYPGYHVETSKWKVQSDAMDMHAGLVGVEYAF